MAQVVIHSMEHEGGYWSAVSVSRRGPVGRGPCSYAPAEAAITLAMDMVAVVGSLDVNGLIGQRFQVNGLRGSQRLQDGIEPLPRPLQQAAEAGDGDAVGRGPQTVVGSLALLLEDLWGQEPGQLLILVEPVV